MMKNHVLRTNLSVIVLGIVLVFGACKTSKAVKGGAIGGTAGGVIGAAIGDHYGNTAAGAIIGAALGGSAGAIIGKRMDKQAEELEEELEGATVERVGEGILVTFESGLVFAVNETTLNANTKKNLDEMAVTLNKYEDTNIHIEGHTDSSGKEEYNQMLSEKRGKSVMEYLATKGVSADRMDVEGYGETKPVADNETEEGRQKNRRVELAIYANEDMQQAAQDGTLKD